MDIIDEKREEFGPKLQEFAALRDKSDRLPGIPHAAALTAAAYVVLDTHSDKALSWRPQNRGITQPAQSGGD